MWPTKMGLYVGYEDGSFHYVMRIGTDAGDHFMFKSIEVQGRARAATVNWRDAYYDEITPTTGEIDGFDPRLRPWYAAATRGLNDGWTEPYIFWTTKRPGISVARSAMCPGGTACVVGVDITLADLSLFFGKLEDEIGGRAFLLTADGKVVAASEITAGAVGRTLMLNKARTLPEMADIGASLLLAAWHASATWCAA